MARNLQVTLVSRPVGEPKESDFALVESEPPEPGDGEVLVRGLWLSLDPYMRGRMSEARSYARPVELGEVMTGQGVGEVIESRSSRFAVGEIVVGPFGWQELAAAPAHHLRRVDPEVAPISTALHVLGMTGLTAYFGLFEVCRPLPGDTVVVSAASGAVGQIVGQLARIAGCRAVGLAGSPEKVDDLLQLYGYDAGIDYRAEDAGEALKRTCPDGVNVYFDNVGGEISAAVHRRLAQNARIAICGQISEYNQVPPQGGPSSLRFMIVSRARMEGFLVSDFAHLFEPALARLTAWLREGRLRYREDVVEGLDRTPRAFIGLLNGENRGKLLVKVADPVSFDGTVVQNEIYIGGAEWPITPAEWETRAEAAIEPEAFGYIAGGAGSELTMRANREAFERRRLRPRMLTGNKERDLTVEVLGTRSAAPFLLAPIGVLSIAHPEGELACARAAAAAGVPFILSSAASHSIEEIAEAMGDAPRWFQLYWINDREVAASFVDRAANAGFGAIVLTLDTLILGWRPRDLARSYLPFLSGQGCAQYFTDPVFLPGLEKPPEEDLLTAAATMLSTFPNLGLTWDDLGWLRGQVELPLLVKGVLTAEDAVRARDCGVDGIIVSNHGGRQVDGAVAALDAYIEVREALGNDATVLVDGGIRTGADVLKAMALGADAVLVGRPYAYGLAAGGQPGVEAVLRQLLAETDITLALLGGRAARDLDRTFLAG